MQPQAVADDPGQRPRRWVVMGVSGSGKTSVGQLLAQKLGLPFVEGDDDHPPANRQKMAAGIALQDEDRQAWLERLRQRIAKARAIDSGMVLSCSALKRRYRDVLRQADPQLFFVHLHGSRELLMQRLQKRRGHFMPPSLLASQLADLEPLQLDEHGIVVDVSAAVEEVVQEIVTQTGLTG